MYVAQLVHSSPAGATDIAPLTTLMAKVLARLDADRHLSQTRAQPPNQAHRCSEAPPATAAPRLTAEMPCSR